MTYPAAIIAGLSVALTLGVVHTISKPVEDKAESVQDVITRATLILDAEERRSTPVPRDNAGILRAMETDAAKEFKAQRAAEAWAKFVEETSD